MYTHINHILTYIPMKYAHHTDHPLFRHLTPHTDVPNSVLCRHTHTSLYTQTACIYIFITHITYMHGFTTLGPSGTFCLITGAHCAPDSLSHTLQIQLPIISGKSLRGSQAESGLPLFQNSLWADAAECLGDSQSLSLLQCPYWAQRHLSFSWYQW